MSSEECMRQLMRGLGRSYLGGLTTVQLTSKARVQSETGGTNAHDARTMEAQHNDVLNNLKMYASRQLTK